MSTSDETAPSPVEQLVSEALDLLEREGPQALEALLAQHPERATAVRRRLRWLVDTGLADTASSGRATPQRLGDFELSDALGQGGMGVVYRARQLSLDREVALKLVRPEQLLFPGQRERFRREVAVIASLAHPGIVPIYAVGEELGTPYFAMERIRGASLSAVLDVLESTPASERSGAHLVSALEQLGADPREPTSSLYDGDWPAVCTRIAREAAEALEHAHRRGVVHRDVKPSNLMVTRGGRVLWVDFGLASDIDSQVAPAQQRLTRTGLRVGTLAYMSPEQLRGERRVDPRTDVFALGVTLYELLAGKLPFDESAQVRRTEGAGFGVPRDLRRIDSRISRELETVVQTATALDPKERYASAADFARDLGAVLEGRAIEARAASPLRLAALWVRRHPGWALAGALALAAPSLLAWREHRARNVIADKNEAIERSAEELASALEQVTKQRDATELERARAQDALEHAHEAVDRMLSRVGGEALVDTPRSEPVRRALLEDALELQERLLAEPVETRSQRARHAQTLHRSAAIRAEMGEFGAALELLARQALELDALLAEAPNDALALQRAICEYRQGEVLKLQGDLTAAREALEDALRRFEALAGAGELLARSRSRARVELADVLARTGLAEGREELLRSAVAELEPLAAAQGAAWELRFDLVRALHGLGATPHELVGDISTVRDPRADKLWLERAIALLAELARERPGHPMASQREAQARADLALRLMQLRDLDGAAREYDSAIELFEALVRDFPSRPMHADGLGSALYNRSLIATMQQEPGRRLEHLRRAAEVYDGLEKRAALSSWQQRSRALVWMQMGAGLGPTDEGAAAFERALELGTPLLERDRDGSLRRALAWAAANLGDARLELGDPQAGARAAERLVELAPRAYDRAYAASLFLRCSLHSGVESESAEGWRERSLEQLERLVDEPQIDSQTREHLRDGVFDALADEPRYTRAVDALNAKR